jgi:hypothetical protein
MQKKQETTPHEDIAVSTAVMHQLHWNTEEKRARSHCIPAM